ncbi:MAG: citrate lyase acyl carrier protein [Candidatus Heimdallarchaeota archaeon]|nr:citrate lyase acyl carrier protein [Candidatus Heimdallarchaeota archaeon]
MKILRSAQAGSLESQDILITVESGKPDSGIVIELDSPSAVQYGKKIHNEIESVVNKFGIEDVYIKAIDKGALGFTIKARIEVALSRAISEQQF